MSTTVWTKKNNVAEAAHDTTGTDGRIPLSSTAGKFDKVQVAPYGSCAVILDGSTYKMWYQGWDGNGIAYATSDDGLTWTKYNTTIEAASNTAGTNGRIPLGTGAGKADTTYCYTPTVIKDGSTYKMWYVGYNGTDYSVTYATSADGLSWTKYNNVVEATSDTTGTDGRLGKSTSAGKADSAGVRGLSVVKVGSTYYMYYIGWSSYTVCLATSDDGLTWTKYNTTIPATSDTAGTDGRIPLGSTAGRGDITLIYNATVFYDTSDSTFKMWYHGQPSSGTRNAYYATSADGLSWTKVNNVIPDASDAASTDGRIPVGSNGKGDDARIYPGCVIVDSTEYKFYYCGHDGAVMRIYLATATLEDNSSSSSTSSSTSESSSSSTWLKSSSSSSSSSTWLKSSSSSSSSSSESSSSSSESTSSSTSSSSSTWLKSSSSSSESSGYLRECYYAYDFGG